MNSNSKKSLPLRSPGVRTNVVRKSFHRFTVIALISMSVFGANAAEPSLKDAMQAPAGDLAQAYLTTNYVLERVLPYAEMGVVDTMHIGGDKITSRNASSYKKRYKKRKKIYAEAISKRGQEPLAGTYKGIATESCARVASSWIGLIQSGEASEIKIEQDGANAMLEISVLREGKTRSLKSEAAVVESSIAVSDKMNSDYYSLGEAKDGKVVIRPDVRVLPGWPAWASPPTRQDILNCSVELIPVDQAGSAM